MFPPKERIIHTRADLPKPPPKLLWGTKGLGLQVKEPGWGDACVVTAPSNTLAPYTHRRYLATSFDRISGHSSTASSPAQPLRSQVSKEVSVNQPCSVISHVRTHQS